MSQFLSKFQEEFRYGDFAKIAREINSDVKIKVKQYHVSRALDRLFKGADAISSDEIIIAYAIKFINARKEQRKELIERIQNLTI